MMLRSVHGETSCLVIWKTLNWYSVVWKIIDRTYLVVYFLTCYIDWKPVASYSMQYQLFIGWRANYRFLWGIHNQHQSARTLMLIQLLPWLSLLWHQMKTTGSNVDNDDGYFLCKWEASLINTAMLLSWIDYSMDQFDGHSIQTSATSQELISVMINKPNMLGYNLVGDNIDLAIKARYMRTDGPSNQSLITLLSPYQCLWLS